MNIEILVIAFIAILVGMCCGGVIVLLIVIQRRRQQVDSMVSGGNAVGLFGTVEVPFDHTCRGKVRVNVKGIMVDFTARTDDVRGFSPGDRVFIVDAKGNQVWVVGENSLSK